MDPDPPVIRGHPDLSTWRRLDAIEAGGNRRGLLRPPQLASLAETVIARSDASDSALLVRMIGMAHSSRMPNFPVVVQKLAAKRRPCDCRPPLKAAEVFLDMDNTVAAKAMADTVSGRGDDLRYNLVQGRLLLREGDVGGAVTALSRALNADRGCMQAYELLHRADPGGGWMFRRNIELLHLGRNVIPYGGGPETSAEKLYGVYWNWYRGNQDSVPRSLLGSKEFRDRDPEFVLAAARFSAEDRDWEAALPFYADAVSLMPRSGSVLSEAAEVLRQAGRPQEALALYGRAGSTDSSPRTVVAGMMRAFSDMGLGQEASVYAARLVDMESAGKYALEECADILVRNGLFEDARKILDMLEGTYPKDPEIQLLKASLEMASGNPSAALRPAAEAVRLSHGETESRCVKALALHRMGRTDQALRELQYVLDADPEDTDALRALREVLQSRGEDGPVREIDAKLSALDPDYVILASEDGSSPVSEMSVLSEQGRHAEALDVLRANPWIMKEPVVMRMKGDAEYATGKYAEASASFELAAQQDPSLWNSKAMADEMRGDLISAEEACDRAIAHDQDDPSFWITKSSIQEKAGYTFDAMISIDRALLLEPRDPCALTRKASLLMSASMPEDALTVLNAAESADPGNRRIQSLRDEILRSMGYKIRPPPGPAEEAKATETSQRTGHGRPEPDPVVKRNAERLLRNAYRTGMAASDPRLLCVMDLEDGVMRRVLEYLGDISVYGSIDPSSQRFTRMECLSYRAIVSAKISDIEEEPLMTVPCAFVASGTEDVDEAKELVAYVYQAMTSTLGEPFMTQDIERMAADAKARGRPTVYGVMKAYKVGVVTARSVVALALR